MLSWPHCQQWSLYWHQRGPISESYSKVPFPGFISIVLVWFLLVIGIGYKHFLWIVTFRSRNEGVEKSEIIEWEKPVSFSLSSLLLQEIEAQCQRNLWKGPPKITWQRMRGSGIYLLALVPHYLRVAPKGFNSPAIMGSTFTWYQLDPRATRQKRPEIHNGFLRGSATNLHRLVHNPMTQIRDRPRGCDAGHQKHITVFSFKSPKKKADKQIRTKPTNEPTNKKALEWRIMNISWILMMPDNQLLFLELLHNQSWQYDKRKITFPCSNYSNQWMQQYVLVTRFQYK